MSLIDRPIQVWVDKHNRPIAFVWGGRKRRVVEVLEWWKEIGEWWEADPPEERTVYRVVDDAGGVYEIDFREPERRWYLYRVYD